MSNNTLINLSNHEFLPEQHALAKELYGDDLTYVRIPFPNIDAGASSTEVKALADKYVKKIMNHNPKVVHIAGEPVFVFLVVNMLARQGIKCVSSTTERIVIEEGDKKISKFKFNHFREFIADLT